MTDLHGHVIHYRQEKRDTKQEMMSTDVNWKKRFENHFEKRMDKLWIKWYNKL